MDWIQFAIFIVSMLGMFSWLRSDIALNRSEAAADRRDMNTILRELKDEMKCFQSAMAQESKDFHGKLERQDAEFKGKIALQDAEFKAHLMYEHGKAK